MDRFWLSNVRQIFFESPPPSLLAFTAFAETVSLASLCVRLLAAPSTVPFMFVYPKIVHSLYLALLDVMLPVADSGAGTVTV
jgi:hypothetical protein